MKKLTLFLAFALFSVVGFAQIQDPESNSGEYGSEDTTEVQLDENGNPIEPAAEGSEAVPAKPYERIVLNMDSITNKITYSGVIEQEESGSDSLYIRAKRWAQVRFSKSEKSLFEIDKKNQKLVINGVLTAYRYNSKYTKRDVGKYHFQMTVMIKEGRYKYQITNFVHEGVKPNKGVPARNYFEFYYTSPKNIKPFDQLLRDADTDIKRLLADFTKSMKDPIIVDEDDW